MRVVLAVLALLALETPSGAATLHGVVFDDANGDGIRQPDERGVADVVVAAGIDRFATTDRDGAFTLVVDGPEAIWAHVPDGFVPGPAWAAYDGKAATVAIALHRLAAPVDRPLRFVVASDSHMSETQEYWDAGELAAIAREATALEPPPAFFTILGDVTQGGKATEHALVTEALDGLGVPFVPVPGNHDWYDDGATWSAAHGPDNYSFDLGGVHFIVWNMAMTPDDVNVFLRGELAHVGKGMPIVALTHAPPTEPITAQLHALGVNYVLSGHTHTNRAVDHDGMVELTTEPFLMGGLDFTPAGYRVVTIAGGTLSSEHRTVVDAPFVSVIAPAAGQCGATELLVAVELDADQRDVTARIDCGTPTALRWAGGWTWRLTLPPLAPGGHEVEIEAKSRTGEHVETMTTFEVCTPTAPPRTDDDWPQLGGNAAHTGTRRRDLPPPLVTRWIAAIGGHALQAAPAIGNGAVYAVATDLGDGDTGGVTAFELATGDVRWRYRAPAPIRGGVAVWHDLAIAAQTDGAVVALDTATGAVRWRYDLSSDVWIEAGAVFSPPTVDGDDVLVGHQRQVAVIDAATGTPRWTIDPVPEGSYGQSLAALAVGDGVVLGIFERTYGGLVAWDRLTGRELWRLRGEDVIAINAAPVIVGHTAFIANAADRVMALDLDTGAIRWKTKLDHAGFGWGNAIVGAPAYARGVLVVPTLYRDLVALDAATGAELWRWAAGPSILRATHYRGAHEAGFEASPLVTGSIVWTAATDGALVALDLGNGHELWRTSLGAPVLASMAASGDWLVAASYDGTLHALAPGERAAVQPTASCSAPHSTGGCCDAGGDPSGALVLGTLSLLSSCGRRRSP